MCELLSLTFINETEQLKLKASVNKYSRWYVYLRSTERKISATILNQYMTRSAGSSLSAGEWL